MTTPDKDPAELAQRAMDERYEMRSGDGLITHLPPEEVLEDNVPAQVAPGQMMFTSEWDQLTMMDTSDYRSNVNKVVVEMTAKCRRFEVAMVVLQMAARDVIAEERDIGGTKLRHSVGVQRIKEAIAALDALAPVIDRTPE